MTDELISEGYSLDLSQGLPVPVTFSIADIAQPQNRKQTISKEVALPDTAANRAFFIGAYSLSTSENGVTFDPTAKTTVILKKRGVQVLDGVLKLDAVEINDRNYTFKCRVLSDAIDVFQLLSTISVNELDWSAYIHTLTRTNIKNSWLAPSGSGYYYPLIERGAGRPGALIWRTVDFVPYVYLYEVLQKVFEWADITWSSTFLESATFKSILFGYGGGLIPTLSILDQQQREVAIDNGDVNYTNTAYTYSTFNPNATYTQTCYFRPVAPNVNPFADALMSFTTTTDLLNQWDDGEIEIQKTGNYSLTLGCVLDYALTVGSMTFVNMINPLIQVSKNGLPVYTITTSTIIYTSASGSLNFNVNSTRNIYAQAGDTISFKLSLGIASCTVASGDTVDPMGVTISTPSVVTMDLLSLDTTITDGGTVDLGMYLPKMKCSEFLLGCIRQFNLYQSEPDIDKQTTVEPLVDFYTNTDTFTDISQIIDYTKPFEMKPAANEYAKNIAYTFKKASDFENAQYLDRWGEEYGDLRYEQSSYYAKGEMKTEMPWATIVPYQIAQGILAPRFIKIENGVLKPNAGPPRIMFRCAMQNGNIVLRDTETTASENLTQYPLVHHFNSLASPTVDLHFKLVNELYYAATIVTTANCFSEYYSVFINEMTSPAAQLVKCWVKWSEQQIKNRDFGKLIMINGALFRLNKINDFDNTVKASTETELVKVLKAKKKRRRPQPFPVLPPIWNELVTSPPDTGQTTGVVSPGRPVGVTVGLIRG
jgi:hypothetical protein